MGDRAKNRQILTEKHSEWKFSFFYTLFYSFPSFLFSIFKIVKK